MADLAVVGELAAADGHLAVLSTTRPDGTIHSSVVMAGVLDDPATGADSVGVVVTGSARKLAHLRVSGHACVVFKHGWRWAAVEGPVRLEGPDDPATDGAERDLPSLIRSVYVAAGGTHEDWDEFDRAMADDRRCAVFVTIGSVTGNH